MFKRVDPNLVRKVEKFGKKDDWNDCFHCGNCTAICPLTEQGFLFPRKVIRTMQLGLKDNLVASVEPWLCYYCGDCSKTCPREANPGELMMTLRRYLTSAYDWTGLSLKFYTSKFWEFGSLIIMALAVIILFGFINPFPIVKDLNDAGGVQINKMFPIKWVELGDLIMAAIVAAFLISNIFRMWYKTILKDKSLKVPFVSYFIEFYRLILHFATQKRFSKCSGKTYWAGHWLLMSGYVIMFTIIVVFLPWFQTEKIYNWYDPQRILGYYATAGLLFGLFWAFFGRMNKKSEKFKFTHISDWLFLIMLILTTITGILIHIFRINGMPLATYYMYIAHMAVLVPMILIEVPFSKWSHLAYRPFAVYFAHIKKAALKGKK
ncbi:MAG: 4Fe-4S dicluster domain-containing protein [Bacteroidota bacterium]